MLRAGLPEASVRANIKLSISGGQNEPRDAIAGAVWALLAHPDQLARVLRGDVPWRRVFDEYVRWISPIAMSPRRVAQRYTVDGVTLEPEDRVFFMFGSANRDEAFFDDPDRFDLGRTDSSAHIAFGAGPHYCAGAAASKALIAEVALPACSTALPACGWRPAPRCASGAGHSAGRWRCRCAGIDARAGSRPSPLATRPSGLAPGGWCLHRTAIVGTLGHVMVWHGGATNLLTSPPCLTSRAE